ncbi:glycosyltransferase [Azospirillum sp. HJ39]|uniref:glycosyltransferase family 2 protein n=1 Tax=Azospirillum sp. HJ39 TaxID=3159496 RepID=UPI0035582286
MTRISVIVPFHSNKPYLLTCLSSLRSGWSDDVEVIIVQNNDDEKSLVNLEHHPSIRSVYFHKSLGYSLACNIGAQEAKGEYLCFCDADTISITARWWDAHVAELHRDPGAGMASSLLLDDRTGRVQDFGIGWSGYNHFHPCFRAAPDDPRLRNSRRVQMACSAQMTVRHDLFKRIGGFDEQLKFHYQDVEFCLRLAAAGQGTVIVPEAQAYHRGHSAHVSKKPFQIDERGYCTAKHRDILVTDIGRYVRESVERLAADVTLQPLYDLADISTIYDARPILAALAPEVQLRPFLARPMPERDPWHLNLFEVLGRDVAKRPGPLLLLVDSIDALRLNDLWFSLRGHGNDIALDRHGNAAPMADLRERS